MASPLYAVIMAGGLGTRLWPYSRAQCPKQFLDILGNDKSLLQLNYAHARRHVPLINIFVVTHEDQQALVQAHLPSLPITQILCEPLRRNTAPCIAYAANRIQARDPKAIMIVMPSDHYIPDNEAFDAAIKQAIQAAEGDYLVTLGIHPTHPDTGYGYIQFVDLPAQETPFLKKVKTFTEKPALAFAQKFLESGDFLWNAGIFIWRTDAILRALQTHIPVLYEVFAEGEKQYNTSHEATFLSKAYAMIPTISIDYAVLEKHEDVLVVPCHFKWSDVGSWQALYDICKTEPQANVTLHNTQLMPYHSTNNLIYTHAKKKVVLIEGLEDYLVADFEDVLIICNKSQSTAFRKYVEDMRLKKGHDYV